MIIVLSPSKSMNFEDGASIKTATHPLFSDKAAGLMKQLKHFKPEDILEREKLSAVLARSTYEHIQTYFAGKHIQKQALYAYSGNVYDKLEAHTLNEANIAFAQQHVCIFSALYGILRPLDMIFPYRLDMNSGLITGLYDFWKEKVTKEITSRLNKDDKVLVNLASAEYFKLIDRKKLPSGTKLISPVFQQEIKGKLVTNSMFAKQARGMMLRFLITNSITNPEHIKAFDDEGYFFNPRLSRVNEWYFTR